VGKQRGGCDRLAPSGGPTQVGTTLGRSFRAIIGSDSKMEIEVAL
jgi:hypothetical protein